MRHILPSPLPATLAVAAAAMAVGVSLAAFLPVARAQAQGAGDRAELLGAALPGGAVLSARSVAVAPMPGGTVTAAPIATDGSFRLAGLAPGRYRLAVTTTAVAKQTQGATFGEKVNSGLHAAGSAVAQGATLARHEAAKNSVGNIRGRAAPEADAGTPPAEAARGGINGINQGMPNRISMNVTIARQTQPVVVDDTVIEVDVGPDGALAGRVLPD